MKSLREHYERVLALVAALFLLLCLVLVFFAGTSFHNRFRPVPEASLPNEYKSSRKSEEMAGAVQGLRTPPQWTAKGSPGLFVPEKYFIGANGEPVALRGTPLHPPVPNEWLEEFGLPIAESDVLTQDADSDGFTNREEWEAHTNPINPDSHPAYISKLRLRSASEEAFPLIFSSSIGDTYAINNLDRRKPTQFLRLSQMVEGTRYKLVGYQERHTTNKYGTTIDVSELTIEQTETHDLVRLVKEQPTISPQSVANFSYNWGGTEQQFSVKKDQEFSLKPAEETKYRLTDVQPEKAIIAPVAKPDEFVEIGFAPGPGQSREK